MFLSDPQAITHNQDHKGEGNAGGYSRASQCIQPPSSNSAIANRPSSVHQNTRWITGASILPPPVMVSMTSEPELGDVTKKIIKAIDIGVMPACGAPHDGI